MYSYVNIDKMEQDYKPNLTFNMVAGVELCCNMDAGASGMKGLNRSRWEQVY